MPQDGSRQSDARSYKNGMRMRVDKKIALWRRAPRGRIFLILLGTLRLGLQQARREVAG
jgi:hypothetical protein